MIVRTYYNVGYSKIHTYFKSNQKAFNSLDDRRIGHEDRHRHFFQLKYVNNKNSKRVFTRPLFPTFTRL